MAGWKAKLLLTGGKEALIKSVAQALPVYVMSIFKLSKKVIKRLMVCNDEVLVVRR